MANLPTANEKKIESAQSRIIPFSIAGIICFSIALLLGAGGWYLFGTNHRLLPEKNTVAVQTNNQNSAVENTSPADNSVPIIPAPAAAETKKAPAGEVSVGGGEITLGGGDTKLPLRRIAVEPFAVGETEVTNAQYAEFVQEAEYPAPPVWKNNKFPTGGAEEPVVGVSWTDANAYCEWLSKKLGATVRLPSEAEWELAARANTDYKYPWGNRWDDEAAESKETNGRVRPVKSFPKGRSPVGAYDLVGNVWEWTSDLFVDEFGNPVLADKTKQRIIKGGSAQEKRDTYLFIKARRGTPENLKFNLLGFRYVIIRK